MLLRSVRGGNSHAASRSDDPFAERFAYAQTIAAQVEGRLVRFDSPRDLIDALDLTIREAKLGPFQTDA